MKIFEAAELALKQKRVPLTIDEIYELILKNDWYRFSTDVPKDVIRIQIERRTPGYSGEWKDVVKFVKEDNKYRLFIPSVDSDKKKDARETAKDLIGNKVMKALEKEGIEVVWKSELDFLRFAAACKGL